ncbi:MAG: GyrI-like domain-containing protein [Dehalococcoidia bacterium]|nr:GyrI-like domain-containing protein [Dehalococcoidia bacterium]
MAAVHGWFREQGHEVDDGVCIEWYRNVHGTVPEDELWTDQYIPLA